MAAILFLPYITFHEGQTIYFETYSYRWFNTYKMIYYRAVLAINSWILVFEDVLSVAILNLVKILTLPKVKSGAKKSGLIGT